MVQTRDACIIPQEGLDGEGSSERDSKDRSQERPEMRRKRDGGWGKATLAMVESRALNQIRQVKPCGRAMDHGTTAKAE